MTDKHYDIAIIGGGLAGLALAIQSAKQGYTVVLFEKETYPQHKVCGEYISLESWNFLSSLGIPLNDLQVPIIQQLVVTSPNGNVFQHALPLGGFGISRYKLDWLLFELATKAGVTVLQETKVTDVQFSNDVFTLQTTAGAFTAAVAAACYGKRSNLDVKWKRPFIVQKPNKLNNYIGVKYHIRYPHPVDTIALHNFENGYCGISKIEDDRYCLCYLTTAVNLQNSNNSIQQMEKEILHCNPHLQKIFTQAEFLYAAPVTISQISFAHKQQVEDHLLMMGDAAGMITPLCGNGMALAIHSAKVASAVVADFLSGKISRPDMEKQYARQWNQLFSQRLWVGRQIQNLFGSEWASDMAVNLARYATPVASWLVKQTHGNPF